MPVRCYLYITAKYFFAHIHAHRTVNPQRSVKEQHMKKLKGHRHTKLYSNVSRNYIWKTNVTDGGLSCVFMFVSVSCKLGKFCSVSVHTTCIFIFSSYQVLAPVPYCMCLSSQVTAGTHGKILLWGKEENRSIVESVQWSLNIEIGRVSRQGL